MSVHQIETNQIQWEEQRNILVVPLTGYATADKWLLHVAMLFTPCHQPKSAVPCFRNAVCLRECTVVKPVAHQYEEVWWLGAKLWSCIECKQCASDVITYNIKHILSSFSLLSLAPLSMSFSISSGVFCKVISVHFSRFDLSSLLQCFSQHTAPLIIELPWLRTFERSENNWKVPETGEH